MLLPNECSKSFDIHFGRKWSILFLMQIYGFRVSDLPSQMHSAFLIILKWLKMES